MTFLSHFAIITNPYVTHCMRSHEQSKRSKRFHSNKKVEKHCSISDHIVRFGRGRLTFLDQLRHYNLWVYFALLCVEFSVLCRRAHDLADPGRVDGTADE